MQDTEVFTPQGPTWFRGQALCYPYTEAENLDRAGETSALLGSWPGIRHRRMAGC